MLVEILTALDERTVPLQLVETWFYLRYADLLGHALNLREDIAGASFAADKHYTYDVSEQGLREAASGDITGDHIKLLRLMSVKPVRVLGQISGLEPILPVCLLTARQHASL